MFQIPAAVDKFDGQPVEQLRMAWLFALQSEVVDRAHQARAETKLPQVVDHHACSQRILAVDQPLRQTTTVTGSACRPRGDLCWYVALDAFTFLVPHATNQHVGGAWFFALGQDHDVDLLGLGHVVVLPTCAIDGGLGGNEGGVVGEELREETIAQCRIRLAAVRRGSERFERRDADFFDRRAAFVGDGEAEASDVGVAQGRALPQFDGELFVLRQYQRFPVSRSATAIGFSLVGIFANSPARPRGSSVRANGERESEGAPA